jgi:hypothetical protein
VSPGLGYAGAVVLDGEQDVAAVAADLGADRAALSVQAGVGQEVPHHSLEHGFLAREHQGLAADLGRDGLGFGAHQGEKVDGDEGPPGHTRLGAGRDQQLVDQGIQLGDVLARPAGEVAAAKGIRLLGQQLDRHADAGERRAQLMRGGGQHLAFLGE